MPNAISSPTKSKTPGKLIFALVFLSLTFSALRYSASPVLPEMLLPTLKARISATIVTLPQPLADEGNSFCTWGACKISPRLYHEPLPDGEILVGWTDINGNGHVSLIANGAIAHTYDFVATEIRGLTAHDDGSFALLLWDSTADIMWLARQDESGNEIWRTNLNSDFTIADFGLGDGRLTYGNGRYLAYFTVLGVSGDADGHYGDQLTYVDDNGNIITGGWDWGSSHSMAQLVSYHPDFDQFAAISSSDCFPDKGIRSQNGHLYLSDGNCGGNVAAQLGQVAIGDGAWKLVFNALDMPCCEGRGIALATIDGAYQSSHVWLTQTDGVYERDPVLARLGDPAQTEQYLVGWTTIDDGVYWLAIIDGVGNFLEGPEEVSSAGMRWGNRDDSFRTWADGSVSWVQGDAETTELRLFHFQAASNNNQVFLPIIMHNHVTTDACSSGAPGESHRISVAADGTQANGSSTSTHHVSTSADGCTIVFSSDATNLVPGDTNEFRDVFVYNRWTEQTTRVSVASNGAQGNGDSGYIGSGPPFAPGISDDGRYVVFESQASNLVANDTTGVTDIFVHDLHTSTTTRVSVASDSTQANGPSYDPFISANGRYVTFTSTASNLVPGDTAGSPDIFVYDRLTGQTTRVSTASDGSAGNGDSGHASISADGRYVAFDSYAGNLVTGDTNSVQDIFVHDRHTGQTIRVSVTSNGMQADGDSLEPMISANGHWIVFSSHANNLVAGDTNGRQDIFLHNRLTGHTTRVSIASDGAQANDISNVPSISGNGRFVTFQSPATNLVPGDANSNWDAFVHDRVTGETARVSVSSSGVEGNNPSWNTSISSDGRFVTFTSFASNLVPGDTNGTWDVFVHNNLVIERIAFNCGFNVCIMNADGTGQTLLASSAGSIAWSPDGTRIAFDSTRDGNPEIYIMNVDGSGLTRLTNHPASDSLPHWSPDGARIVFQSDRDGDSEIYVMNVDDSGLTQLTYNAADDGLAAWSPDGTQIVFVSDRDGDNEIYVMNADGSEQTQLTHNSSEDAFPDWSPDSTRIVFASDRDGNSEIYVMNADGSEQTRLTNNLVADDYPVWSPDGTRIAFDSYRDGNWEIYVMNADGSEQTRLTNSPETDFALAWQP